MKYTSKTLLEDFLVDCDINEGLGDEIKQLLNERIEIEEKNNKVPDQDLINKVLPSDLLQQCLSYLSFPNEIYNFSYSCKIFYIVSEKYPIHFETRDHRKPINRNSFMNDMTGKSLMTEPQSDVSDNLNSPLTPFTVVKSTEELALLWKEGRQRCQSYEEMYFINIEGQIESEITQITNENVVQDIFPIESDTNLINTYPNFKKIVKPSTPSSNVPTSSSTNRTSLNEKRNQITNDLWIWNVGSEAKGSVFHTINVTTISIPKPFSQNQSFNQDNDSDLLKARNGLFQLKLRYLKKQDIEIWESLYCGWLWVQNHIRKILRDMWNKHLPSFSTFDLPCNHINASCNKSIQPSPSLVTTEILYHTRKCGFDYINEDSEHDASSFDVQFEAASTFAAANSHQIFHKALKKLVKCNWRECYSSMKNEIFLQSQALCRDIVSIIDKKNNIPSERIKYNLNLLHLVYHCSMIYIGWCEELHEISWALNDKICPEDDIRLNLDDLYRNKRSKHRMKYQSRCGRDFEDDENASRRSFSRRTVSSNNDWHSSSHASLTEIGYHGLRNHLFLCPLISNYITNSIDILGMYVEGESLCDTGSQKSLYNEAISVNDIKHYPYQNDYSEAVTLLVRFHHLIEILDVPDDSGISDRCTRNVFWAKYGIPLMKLCNLAPYLRHEEMTRKRSLEL